MGHGVCMHVMCVCVCVCVCVCHNHGCEWSGYSSGKKFCPIFVNFKQGSYHYNTFSPVTTEVLSGIIIVIRERKGRSEEVGEGRDGEQEIKGIQGGGDTTTIYSRQKEGRREGLWDNNTCCCQINYRLQSHPHTLPKSGQRVLCSERHFLSHTA